MRVRILALVLAGLGLFAPRSPAAPQPHVVAAGVLGLEEELGTFEVDVEAEAADFQRLTMRNGLRYLRLREAEAKVLVPGLDPSSNPGPGTLMAARAAVSMALLQGIAEEVYEDPEQWSLLFVQNSRVGLIQEPSSQKYLLLLPTEPRDRFLWIDDEPFVRAVPGDRFESLASSLYFDPSLSHEIYLRNRLKIPTFEDPSQIFASPPKVSEKLLHLPMAPTAVAVITAKKSSDPSSWAEKVEAELAQVNPWSEIAQCDEDSPCTEEMLQDAMAAGNLDPGATSPICLEPELCLPEVCVRPEDCETEPTCESPEDCAAPEALPHVLPEVCETPEACPEIAEVSCEDEDCEDLPSFEEVFEDCEDEACEAPQAEEACESEESCSEEPEVCSSPDECSDELRKDETGLPVLASADEIDSEVALELLEELGFTGRWAAPYHRQRGAKSDLEAALRAMSWGQTYKRPKSEVLLDRSAKQWIFEQAELLRQARRNHPGLENFSQKSHPAQLASWTQDAAKSLTSVPAVEREALMKSLMNTETRLRHDQDGIAIVSYSGAIGLGQFLPRTAAGLGINPYDPKDNIRGIALYLNDLIRQAERQKARGKDIYQGDPIRQALVWYNGGQKNPAAEAYAYSDTVFQNAQTRMT